MAYGQLEDHEIDAWLGDTELTDDQREEFHAAVREHHKLADDDQDDYLAEEEGNAVWWALLRSILGEETLADVGARHRQAQVGLERVRDEVRAWIIASDILGVPRAQIARESGYNSRTSVYSILDAVGGSGGAR